MSRGVGYAFTVAASTAGPVITRFAVPCADSTDAAHAVPAPVPRTILWPSGQTQVLNGLAIDQLHVVTEPR